VRSGDARSSGTSNLSIADVDGLEVEPDQAYIYLGIREMAHTRLFKHSKWLRDGIVGQITNYAIGIKIDRHDSPSHSASSVEIQDARFRKLPDREVCDNNFDMWNFGVTEIK